MTAAVRVKVRNFGDHYFAATGVDMLIGAFLLVFGATAFF